jgi:ABC-2 type transport system ATP-binding protein
MQDIFRQLSRRGATVFLSTHLLEVAEKMCDRIGIIDHGRLIALGTVEELRTLSDQPGNLEDLFLQLTGGPEAAELAAILA